MPLAALTSGEKKGKIVTTEDSSKPISKYEETLYIVSHGDRENHELSSLRPEKLADIVQEYGLNPRIKHLKIHLVCCHSGHKINMLIPSFAQRFYSALLND
jgi:hypothetical protein